MIFVVDSCLVLRLILAKSDNALKNLNYDIFFHLAAYTNVPGAEKEKAKAESGKKKQKQEEAIGREDPGNPIWAQLDATQEAVPEMFLKAGKKLKWDLGMPINTLEEAKKIMATCNTLADGGK